MYKIGETVVYGSEGVCKIKEITAHSFGQTGAENTYYILSPESNPNSKIFVPCNNDALVSKMQKVLSAKEIKEMIEATKELPEWISDNRQRNKNFKEILQSYDRAQILSLAKLLHVTKTEGDSQKKLFSSDEELLKKIIKILHAEFSIVLDISLEEVIPYIFGEIECTEK